jgi:hypothetical protein
VAPEKIAKKGRQEFLDLGTSTRSIDSFKFEILPARGGSIYELIEIKTAPKAAPNSKSSPRCQRTEENGKSAPEPGRQQGACFADA